MSSISKKHTQGKVNKMSPLDDMRKMVNKYLPSNASMGLLPIFGIILVVLALVVITIYLVYFIKKSDLKSIELLDTNFKDLNDKNKLPYIIASDKFQASANGQEYTYNFWVYLSENYDSTTQHKLILQRGKYNDPSSTSYSGSSLLIDPQANPVVAMNKHTNEMMIAVSTNRVKEAMPLDKVFERNSSNEFVSPFLITTIDYVPLRRWVNINIIVFENILRVYMDGDIYSVTTTDDMKKGATSTPLIKTNNGELTIGNPAFPTKGYLAKLQFFNHSISQGKITSLYKSGPMKNSWLSFIGLNRYGLQTPIYKVN